MELGGIVLRYKDSKWYKDGDFHRLLRPKVRVRALTPHNLDHSPDDDSKPTFSEIKTEFEVFLKDVSASTTNFYIAAHNGKRYDHRIMCFHGLDPPDNATWGDTIEWCKKRRPNLRSYSVANLHPGGPPPAAHRVGVYFIFHNQ